MSPTRDGAIVDDLRSRVRGTVHAPGDTGFTELSRPWNLAVQQDVLAVVSVADADDVTTVVGAAARTGTAVSPQPSGHGATGSATGTILLRTGALDAVDVDPSGRTATIGAGVTSGALQRATATHALTALPGSTPAVSVAGVALGGGLSWFGRAHGWVADSVIGFEVVDAAGAHRAVDATTDPDLFWALRGGGGDYAVVTALRLRLHPAPSVVGGRMLWEGRHAAAVVDEYRSITAGAPWELTLWLELMGFPWAEPMVALDMTYLGEEAEAREMMAAVERLPRPLSDSRAPMSVAELGTITAEPTDPSPGLARAELLATLDDDATRDVLAAPVAPLNLLQVRHLGGALSGPSDSPHGPLAEQHLLYLFGVPTDPATTARVRARQREVAAALPVSGRKPVTLLGPGEPLSDALPPASLERLRRVKDERDPHRVLRGNASVLDVS
ncbi:FAD-binding oxidoreductase [Georgenia satyanarayanai]|uniref:FAD-binding oxidoreductase n=1 Tax=Georgenia satyanarayanai TaxID=860221 RepID=UPI00203C4124|nr:FAD-binding oxidoreductase [Georgenia satyanarayanai]MCM3660101.1 FAD-binding oxidoreductase [Georgenia satyanarayanai]